MIYEYAGFKFLVDNDKVIGAMPFQHPAAYKEKHRRNAQEMYNQEKEMSTGG